MESRTNQEVFRIVIEEGFGKGNLDALDDCFPPEFQEHQYGLPSTLAGLKQVIASLRRGLPDLKHSIDDMVVDKVRLYYDHPGFLEPFEGGIADALCQLGESGVPFEAVRLLFTTHSVPLAMAEASGPPGASRPGTGGAYVAQHEAAARAVVDGVHRRGLAAPPARLVYQSRSGSPAVPWLEPDINDALREASADGASVVVVVPLGFVSDHVEVVWDLDREAQETAAEVGLRLVRVPTPGTHPAFVDALASLVEERVRDVPAAERPAVAGGPWPDRCPPGCCANLRVARPAIAGSDGGTAEPARATA